VGREAETHRGILKLDYPIEHGVVKDWDKMQEIYKHIY
jgi:centractin